MASSGDEDNGDPVPNTKRHRQMTAQDKKAVFYAIRSTMVNDRPKHGIIKKLARDLGFKPLTISRQWRDMRIKLAKLLNNQDEDDHIGIISAGEHFLFGTGQSSRRKDKFLIDRDEIKEAVLTIPQHERPTMRHLSAKLDLPLTTLYYLLKGRVRKKTAAEGTTIFKRQTVKLKPTLTDENKLNRFMFAMDHIKPVCDLGVRGGYKFDGQYDKVHIDEKWFFLSKDGKKYILVEGEQAPHRTVRHKKYMAKVMFLCAVARPRWDVTKRAWWDGKLGMWPIGDYGKAQRTSKLRAAGTRVWHNENMGFGRFRMMIIDDLIPAIQALWPVGEWTDPNFKITVQQDGAGAHPQSWKDPVIQSTLRELEANGNFTPGKINFEAQPPNSPDTNICDLGLFNAVQASYYNTCPKNAMEIIEMVQKTWLEYPHQKINRLFVTLQSVYNSIIEEFGGNDYKLTHMNKDRLEREGNLPRELSLTEEAIRIVQQYNNSRNGNDPLTDSDVDFSDDEADENLATLRGRANNNDLYGDNDGSDSDSDGDSVATGNASTWSMDTAQEAIFRKVEADMKAEIKAREDDSDSDDSDEEASANSDYSSLSPEDLAYYKQVEADMQKEGTL
jgi:hypothetical protein